MVRAKKVFFSSAVFGYFVCALAEVTDRQYAMMPDLFHLDDFDRCMLYDEEYFYCMITFQIYPENPANPSQTWNVVKEVSSKPSNYRHDLLRHGVCVTETCPLILKNSSIIKNPEKLKQEVSKCYSEKYRHMGLKGEVIKMFCQDTESPYPIDNFSVVFGIFVVFYLIFVIFASLYEGTARYKSDEEYKKITQTQFGKFVSAFSIARNWYRLTTVDLNNPDIRSLRAFQGVRFYNMICVILMHTVMTHMAVPVKNPRYVETMTEKYFNLFLANGGFAVQTFFMMSTWLLTHQFFTQFEGKKEITAKFMVSAFVNRYIRLTPAFAVIIAFHCSSWFVRMSRGPFWDEIVGVEYRNCRENWWTNLLFINTYVNRENMCLAQSWYLAIDTQFFIISLICLWFMWHNPKIVPSLVAAILGLNIFILFSIIYWNNWESTLRPTPENVYAMSIVKTSEWHILLGSVYSNLPGLAAGLGYGYIFYKYRDTNLFTNKFQVTIWWILVWGLSLGIIVIPGMMMYAPGYEHIRIFAAIYGATSRVIFIFGIGLGLFGMTQGIGWMMKWTCECSPTYVLGRLSYSAFLVHTAYERVRMGSRRTPNFLADHIIFSDLLSDIASSFMFATFLTLLVEMPISELQKLMKRASITTNINNNGNNKNKTL